MGERCLDERRLRDYGISEDFIVQAHPWLDRPAQSALSRAHPWLDSPAQFALAWAQPWLNHLPQPAHARA
jgi:hypothetical protein